MAGEKTYRVMSRCHLSFDTNTRYISYYVAERTEWRNPVRVLLNDPAKGCDAAASLEFSHGNPALGIPMSNSSGLRFVGKVLLYIDVALDERERLELIAAASERSLNIEIRDVAWLEAYNREVRPLAFVSHDSRDKDDVVRPLVLALGSLMCPVWYDEFSLKIGDSLSESIGRGIQTSANCILVLSRSFIENPGWTKAEFRAVINRHISGEMRILPIWHQLSRQHGALLPLPCRSLQSTQLDRSRCIGA